MESWFNERPGGSGPATIWHGRPAPWDWLQADDFLRPGVRGQAFPDGMGALLRPKDLSRAIENRLLGVSSHDFTAH